jgi:hypothetical protein
LQKILKIFSADHQSHRWVGRDFKQKETKGREDFVITVWSTKRQNPRRVKCWEIHQALPFIEAAGRKSRWSALSVAC